MKHNYQKMLENKIVQHEKKGEVPTLLLHSCCAPCSSYCLEYLSEYFHITVFYYNPNIYPEEEYHKRAEEQERFIEKFPAKYPVSFVEGNYDKERFYEMAKGLEDVKEGGERCFLCYELRLREAARLARRMGMDYFTTTLSISPLKNAEKLNEIGERLAAEYGVKYLNSDFKKKNGYKRSVELSGEYGMYRQYYCGCVFSKKQRDEEIAAREAGSAGVGEEGGMSVLTRQESIALLDSLYPNFFERENIRNIPDEWICDEMILALDKFEPHKYDKKLDDNISFGYYEGDIEELKKAVERVVLHWAQSYNENQRIYCGYIDGKIASFCLIEDMGVHTINGREVRIGGPGCVGTLPEYRNQGIGLIMVEHVTQILKKEGYDYSYIHFTGVAPWYEKLGYRTSVRWTKNGVV